MDIIKETMWLIKASKYVDINLQNLLGLRLALFYELLPDAFTTRQALLVGCVMKISPRMVANHLRRLQKQHLLEKLSRSLYSKTQ